MRLFIALNLPKKQRSRVFSATRVLRKEPLPVRWLDPESYHVTLKFLGEVRAERVSDIEAAIAHVAADTRAFTTRLGGLGAFPTVRRPRVIWLGVQANPELRCLKQDLEWALGDVGFEAETRSFHPHLTLGRADPAGGAGDFRGLDGLMSGIEIDVDVRVHVVDLMRSQTSREGTSYSVLSGCRLAAG